MYLRQQGVHARRHNHGLPTELLVEKIVSFSELHPVPPLYSVVVAGLHDDLQLAAPGLLEVLEVDGQPCVRLRFRRIQQVTSACISSRESKIMNRHV